jgi:antitoxin component of RelBE/YafQ-DinJ toxin-antitoxin module
MKDTFLKIRLSEEEYINFQKSCENKGKTMSETIRIFVKTYTKSENLILFEIDKETLIGTSSLCKDKKIRFNDLIKYLLTKAISNKDKLNFK